MIAIGKAARFMNGYIVTVAVHDPSKPIYDHT